MEIQEEELKLDDIFAVFRKRWFLMLAPACFISLIVAFVLYFSPKTYQSYAYIKVGQNGGSPLESISTTSELMVSLHMLREIARALDMPADSTGILERLISYKDRSGMLEIRTTYDDPEQARKMVEVATRIVMARHERLYETAQQKLDNVVRYVKETIKPIPLSSGITEFRIEPSIIVVEPVFDPQPLKSNKRKNLMMTFLFLLAADILVAFYLERRR